MECVMFLLLSSLLTFDHRMYRCAEVIDAAATAGDLSSPNLGYIISHSLLQDIYCISSAERREALTCC